MAHVAVNPNSDFLFCLTLIGKLAILHATYGTTITISNKTATAGTLD
jgi:hypothetical protein